MASSKDKATLKKINRLLAHFAGRSARYAGVRLPLKSLADLSLLPVSCREDLVAFAKKAPLQDVFHVTATSGTTRTRLVIARSAQAHATHIRRLGKIYRSAGITPRDLCLNICSYSLNSGGTLMEQGYRAAGAGVIPLGELNTAEKVAEAVDIIKALRPTVVNSYTNQLFPLFAALGKKHSIRRCVVNGEPLFPSFKAQIERMSGARIHDHYGAMEVSGFAVAQKPDDEYMRVFDDGLYLEVLSDNGTTAPYGRGALLVTDTENTCMPFIRYRLGDIVELVWRGGCAWIKVLGRGGDSLLISGVVCAAGDVTRVFQEAVGHPEFFLLIEKDPVTYKDRIVLNVAAGRGACAGIPARLRQSSDLAGLTQVREHVGEVPRTSNGKFRHIIDMRPKLAKV